MKRSQPGEWVDLREVWDSQTWELRRGILVRDETNVVAVYTPPETTAMVAAGPDGTRLRLPPPEWEMTPATTPADRRFLSVHPTGADHSVLAIWSADWQLLHWYINLETDLVRTATGFEYTDHFLDVIVDPAMSAWVWKDEDELAEAVARGLVSRDEAAAFRAEGERAVEWLLARRAPYDEPWEDWRPPDSWC